MLKKIKYVDKIKMKYILRSVHFVKVNSMEITAKQLRIQPGRILSQINNGQEIIITYRGKACAKIIPIKNINLEESDDELFGMWKER